MQKLNETDDVYTIVEEEVESGTIYYHKKNGVFHRHERDAFGDVLPAVIYPDGSAEWWIDGVMTREKDLPAMVYLYKVEVDEYDEHSGWTWLKDGKEHRDTKNPVTGLTNPSHISNGNEMRWCINGVYQRENDLPAITQKNGKIRLWYLNGERGRANGLPTYENDLSGFTTWLDKDGRFHRDGDEPAVVKKDGTFEWYKHGKHHREGDKPAVIRPDRLEWWIDGKRIRVEAR